MVRRRRERGRRRVESMVLRWGKRDENGEEERWRGRRV